MLKTRRVLETTNLYMHFGMLLGILFTVLYILSCYFQTTPDFQTFMVSVINIFGWFSVVINALLIVLSIALWYRENNLPTALMLWCMIRIIITILLVNAVNEIEKIILKGIKI